MNVARQLRLFAIVVLTCAHSARAEAVRYWTAVARSAYDAETKLLRPGTTIPWITSDGRQIWLVEWRSADVSLLTVRDDYDPALVRRLIGALDAYWRTCRELCGNAPPPDSIKGPLVKGRAIIAEAAAPLSEERPESALGVPFARRVPVVAIPGVARVGVGTEVIDDLLRAFAHGSPSAPLGDRVPEAIARTFVFFDSELGAGVPEGFQPLANAMAFLLAGEAQESLGWIVPPDERPFESIVDAYRATPTATYATTLARGEGIGAADAESLWTAMLLRLRHMSGQRTFVRAFWKTLYECPPASDADVAIGNLVVAGSAAARMNLVQQFRDWRFDISEVTAARVQEALAPRRMDVERKPADKSRRSTASGPGT